MLKRPIFTGFTGFLCNDLSYIINHSKTLATLSTHNQIIPQFQLFRKSVTLNVVQGNSNWYQTVEFSSIYHHTKFERNWFISVRSMLTHFGGLLDFSSTAPRHSTPDTGTLWFLLCGPKFLNKSGFLAT